VVALDHFEAGECGWHPFVIAFRVVALPKGLAEVRPLELACRPNRIEDVEALSCVPDRPGELTVIAEDAAEVEVNFADRPSPFSTP
jgi:hypothetical protein